MAMVVLNYGLKKLWNKCVHTKQLMAAQAHPVLVTRNGAPVGEITAEGVFARLLNPGA